MKKKQWLLKNGTIIPFWEYNLVDLAGDNRNIVKSSFIRACYPNSRIKRNIKFGTLLFSKLVIKEFLNIIAEKAIENSDRFIFPDKRSKIYVGEVFDNPNRISKRHKKRQLNFATKGKRYGMLFDVVGLKKEYHIRLPFRIRQDLTRRIRSGQLYHNRK